MSRILVVEDDEGVRTFLVDVLASQGHEIVEACAELTRTSSPSPPPSTAALTWGAPSMRPVVEALSRVARTAATVMLAGESGTGKEVAARAIHAASARASRPFLAINCAVLSEQLFESELFGHEKGIGLRTLYEKLKRYEVR